LWERPQLPPQLKQILWERLQLPPQLEQILWERLQPRQLHQLPHPHSITSGFAILLFRFAGSFINCAIAVVIAIIRFALNTIVVRVIIETMLTLTTWHSRCCIAGSNAMLTLTSYRSRCRASLITFEHSGLVALASVWAT